MPTEWQAAALELSAPFVASLVAAIEQGSDVVYMVRVVGGVAACGPQVGVAKPGGDAVDRHALFEKRRGPVGAKRVRCASRSGTPAASAHARTSLCTACADSGSGGCAPGKRPSPTNTGGSSRGPPARAHGRPARHTP